MTELEKYMLDNYEKAKRSPFVFLIGLYNIIPRHR